MVKDPYELGWGCCGRQSISLSEDVAGLDEAEQMCLDVESRAVDVLER